VPLLEVSDLLVVHDPVTLARVPVVRADAERLLAAAGDPRGVRLLRSVPVRDGGILDEDAVDARLIAVHTELQRLSQELRIGDRLAELLRPLVAAVRAGHPLPDGRIRVVDVGCGLGFLVRWLAAHDILGDDVDLIGVDLHAALVHEAQRLADAEGLRCRFAHADAFRLDEPATVFISTGLLHHFRGPDLTAFFAAQAGPDTAAFCHFDIATTALSPIGAWMFHRARMRDPLGRHDGVMSARRAHDDATLLTAAAAAAPLVPLVFEPRERSNPFCTTLRPVLGVRPDLVAPFRAELGRAARRLTGAR
jgi:SAM-dependent methyltransferase